MAPMITAALSRTSPMEAMPADRAVIMKKSRVGRPSDIVARYGGEEFIVLLPETAWEGAEVVAGRLKRAIEDLAIRHTARPASRYITVCVGVAAALPERLSEKRALVNAADKALYRAKRQGRNRVALAGPGTRSSPPLDRKIPAA